MASASRGRGTVSSPDAERNVKRKNCALDFDTLDCPICLEPLSPPVYQCQNGHTACAGCCKMLTKRSCPSCLLPIGTNRCIVVEKIIESLQVHCKYAAWGCKQMLQYAKGKRDEHEVVCEFRPYHCPAVGCNHEGPKFGFPLHFDKDHGEGVALEPDEARKISLTIRTHITDYDDYHSQYVLVQVSEDEDEEEEEDDDPGDDDTEDEVSKNQSLFLVHHQFHEKLCIYSFSCTSFGACNMSNRYRLSVDMERKRNFKVNHTIEGPIHDNQKDKVILSKVVRHGDSLLVPKVYPQQHSPDFKVELWLL